MLNELCVQGIRICRPTCTKQKSLVPCPTVAVEACSFVTFSALARLACSLIRLALRLAAAWRRTVVFSTLTEWGKSDCMTATPKTRKHCSECGRVASAGHTRASPDLGACELLIQLHNPALHACFLQARHSSTGTVHTCGGLCCCVLELPLSGKQACSAPQSVGLGVCF